MGLAWFIQSGNADEILHRIRMKRLYGLRVPDANVKVPEPKDDDEEVPEYG